jgi:hypothetical protein
MSVPNRPRSEGGERLPIHQEADLALLQQELVEGLGGRLVARLHEHALYRLGGMLDMPDLAACGVQLYRETDAGCRETGGGLQFTFTSADDVIPGLEVEPIIHGVRVLGYRLLDGEVVPEEPLDYADAATLARTVETLGSICLDRDYVVAPDLTHCYNSPAVTVFDTAYSLT